MNPKQITFCFGVFLGGCEADSVETKKTVSSHPGESTTQSSNDDPASTVNSGGQGTENGSYENSNSGQNNSGDSSSSDDRAVGQDTENETGQNAQEIPSDELVSIAQQLDASCALDCALYIRCNSDSANFTTDECIQEFCVYSESIEASMTHPNGFDLCLQAELALYECVVELECPSYNDFMDENLGIDEVECSEPYIRFEDACEPFFEEE